MRDKDSTDNANVPFSNFDATECDFFEWKREEWDMRLFSSFVDIVLQEFESTTVKFLV